MSTPGSSAWDHASADCSASALPGSIAHGRHRFRLKNPGFPRGIGSFHSPFCYRIKEPIAYIPSTWFGGVVTGVAAGPSRSPDALRLATTGANEAYGRETPEPREPKHRDHGWFVPVAIERRPAVLPAQAVLASLSAP